MIPHIISGSGTISMVVAGKSYSIGIEFSNYQKIRDLLLSGASEAEIVPLLDLKRVIKSALKGRISFEGDRILLDGKVLHNSLSSKIVDLFSQGYKVDHLLLFLENLMKNPSARAVNELYDFLSHKGLPITEDGCFLAYKGIRSDWLDKYSGTIKNNIGATICFERNQVDDNRENECSFGLHVGTLAYVRGYCTERVIRVKVNPADCISVPRDHSAQKLRVCRYEILAEHNPEEILTSALYTSSGERSVPEYPDYDICVEDFYDNTEGSVCFVASTINEAPMRTKKRIFKRDRFGRFARTR